MTCTELPYADVLNAVKGARRIANPNFGHVFNIYRATVDHPYAKRLVFDVNLRFHRQLQTYEFTKVKTVSWVTILLFCFL